MSRQHITISIIIVHYKVKEELFGCLRSIDASQTNTSYEIIVVDNDEEKTINADLNTTFPKVTYISNDNNGFGQGCNVGAVYAKGTYLFFLNPDTKVFPRSIDSLFAFLSKDKKVGIVAPMLLDVNGKPFDLQGTSTLTPLRAIFSLTFIHTFFPNNPIAKQYWLPNWDKTKPKLCYVVPGTAFMIRKQLFERLKGFDENFFLYFEEFDLCKRIRDLVIRRLSILMQKLFICGEEVHKNTSTSLNRPGW